MNYVLIFWQVFALIVGACDDSFGGQSDKGATELTMKVRSLPARRRHSS